MEAVTAVLLDRAAAGARGLRPMVAVLAGAARAASRWRSCSARPGGCRPPRPRAPRVVMIGQPRRRRRGPDNGGMNPLGGRPVQQVAPRRAETRPQPMRPPAAKTPEMTRAGAEDAREGAAQAARRRRGRRRRPTRPRGRTPTTGRRGEVRLELRGHRRERPRPRPVDRRRGHRRRRSTSATSAARTTSATMMRSDQGELELRARGWRATTVMRFTDPARRADHRHRRRAVDRLRAGPDGAARAAACCGSCRRCRRRIPNPTLTVYLKFEYQR